MMSVSEGGGEGASFSPAINGTNEKSGSFIGNKAFMRAMNPSHFSQWGVSSSGHRCE